MALITGWVHYETAPAYTSIIIRTCLKLYLIVLLVKTKNTLTILLTVDVVFSFVPAIAWLFIFFAVAIGWLKCCALPHFFSLLLLIAQWGENKIKKDK